MTSSKDSPSWGGEYSYQIVSLGVSRGRERSMSNGFGIGSLSEDRGCVLQEEGTTSSGGAKHILDLASICPCSQN